MIKGSIKGILTNDYENLDINTMDDFNYCDHILKSKKMSKYQF